MRILFTPLAWPTHYYPTVPTAWACRAAGHEVRVASQPALTDTIIRSGLTAVTVGRAYDINTGLFDNARQLRERAGSRHSPKVGEMLNSPEKLRQLRAARLVPHVKAAEATVEDLLAVISGWQPDLVVSDPVVMAAPLAASLAGVPLVRHVWGPDPTPQLGFPTWGLPVADWPEELVELYRRHGATPMVDCAAATIDPCPVSLQSPGIANRLPIRYGPYNGPGELPEWLFTPATKPRVCVTWGLSTTDMVGHEEFRLPDVLKVLTDLDIEIVAAVKDVDRGALGDQPDNVRIVEGLPLQLVLPTCAAIVHHGGAGTLLTAAYYGVPQVVVAPLLSQSFNADRLAATGAGISLKAEHGSLDDIKNAIEKSLHDDTVRRCAEALRDEMLSSPAPAAIIDDLEALASR